MIFRYARSSAWVVLLLITVLGASRVAGATSKSAKTRVALAHLLKASDQAIPNYSSCAGNYLQRGKATIGDLLAAELASLHKGNNTIIGECDQEPKHTCRVSIHHKNGEDVASADLTFKVADGALQIETLSCVITP